MEKLLKKLGCKGEQRVAVLNADDDIYNSLPATCGTITVDRTIDLRFPYYFVVVFVRNAAEVREVTPRIIHNLYADGILWYCFPSKKSTKYKHRGLTLERGWKALHDIAFKSIRVVEVDDEWVAIRFRNSKYIKD